MAESPQPVQASNLTKRYGPVVALDGISLDIPPGAVGLLGPNGAGKTTLIRLMLGLTAASSGQLRVFGNPLPKARMTVRRRIGYSPEIESHFPLMTAIDAVTFAGCLTGMPRTDAFKRAHDVLNRVGLEEARYRRLETFSTGMKQRAKIAQALVHDPELLILDEPTAGLDASGRDQILDLIAEIARGDLTVLLSTHILGDVERVCSHVAVLHHGKAIGQGPIETLLGTGTKQYDLRVDGDREAVVRELHSRGLEAEPAGANLTLKPRDGAVDPVLVFEAAAAAGAAVRHFSPARLTLDEAFLRMVADGDS